MGVGNKQSWQNITRLVSMVTFLALLALPFVGAGTVQTIVIKTNSAHSPGIITATVLPSGAYSVTMQHPAWSFAGNLGVAVSNIAQSTGTDNNGAYTKVQFTYQSPGSRMGSIRIYAGKPYVLFTSTFVAAAANTAPFPHFTTFPKQLHHLYFDDQPFGRYDFRYSDAQGPWTYFDTSGNTFIISAATNFMIAATSHLSDGSIQSGIDPTITTLPAGFSQTTILTVDNGINTTFSEWGAALRTYYGTTAPVNVSSVNLDTLGYWTGNGAQYYNRHATGMNFEQTYIAVKNEFTQLGVPLGYMQLDAWWFMKSPTNEAKDIGIYQFIADPKYLPSGLPGFQKNLGLPLITHARWLSFDSPYDSLYKMSGAVSIDPNYYNHIFSYIKSSGVIMYEQDWLSGKAQPLQNLTDPNAFMTSMAASATSNGLSMLYCMPKPRNYMEGVMFDNLTSTRVSYDRFDRTKWNMYLYDSRLASALGILPWSDVFMSSEADNLLLSTLSAGMVGVGDGLGMENTVNLLQTVRPDGVIVKPDAPIVPIDSMYQIDGAAGTSSGSTAPMIASTYTDHGAGMRGVYVFAYNRGGSTGISFPPATLGIPGQAYVYNYYTHVGQLVGAGQTFTDTVADHNYYLVAPVGASGIAFLGDAGKFVSLGKKRVTDLTDNGTVNATITFAANESSVTVYGYAPSAPHASATNGSVSSVTYNPTTGMFSLTVTHGLGNAATIALGL